MNKRAYKLLLCDLDGTLLTKQKEVTKETLTVLSQMKQKGYNIGIASGRSVEVILRLAKQWGISDIVDYLIASNGTQLYLMKDDVFSQQHLISKEMYHALVSGLYEMDANLYVADNQQHQAYVCRQDEYTDYFARVNAIDCHPCDLRTLTLSAYHKVLVIGKPDKIPAYATWIRKHTNHAFTVYRTLPFCLEVQHVDASKWAGIQRLCELTNISAEDILCFGDQENDVEMLCLCGWGVAMKNALPQIKECAKDCTQFTNEEDGVARYLLAHFLP